MGSPKKRSKSTTKSPKKSKQEKQNTDELSLRKNLTDSFQTELYGYENELKYLNKILNNTVESGESNSLLICGGPGSGKTTLLETCLSKIEMNPNIGIIRLNGIIHGNDLSTIRYIGRQLQFDATDIVHIMSELRNRCVDKQFRAVIILDNFDIFCRRNQTLLYNLFDVCQHSSSICIIGMTSRLDAIDLLEKRVKSRLNQRIIQLVTPFNDFTDYKNFALKLLNGITIDDSLEESLKIQYSINYSVRELKLLLLDYVIIEKAGIQYNIQDRDDKLISLSQLSKYELCVLLIANKYIKNQRKSTFNCSSIMDALPYLPQIKLNKNMLFKIFYKLMETDLIIRHQSIRKNELLMSEWTLYSLNIDDSHLNDVLTKNSNIFPNYMKQI